MALGKFSFWGLYLPDVVKCTCYICIEVYAYCHKLAFFCREKGILIDLEGGWERTQHLEKI